MQSLKKIHAWAQMQVPFSVYRQYRTTYITKTCTLKIAATLLKKNRQISAILGVKTQFKIMLRATTQILQLKISTLLCLVKALCYILF